MHSYRVTDRGYTVGFEWPGPAAQGQMNWRAIKTFQHEEHAAQYTSFLNGSAFPMNFTIIWDPMIA